MIEILQRVLNMDCKWPKLAFCAERPLFYSFERWSKYFWLGNIKNCPPSLRAGHVTESYEYADFIIIIHVVLLIFFRKRWYIFDEQKVQKNKCTKILSKEIAFEIEIYCIMIHYKCLYCEFWSNQCTLAKKKKSSKKINNHNDPKYSNWNKTRQYQSTFY